MNDVTQKGIPVADLLVTGLLLQINHGCQQPLETGLGGRLVAHEPVNVPNVVQNDHGLGDQNALFADQNAISNLVIRQGLSQKDSIHVCIGVILIAGDGILRSSAVGRCGIGACDG